jgi:hypothetical protein
MGGCGSSPDANPIEGAAADVVADVVAGDDVGPGAGDEDVVRVDRPDTASEPDGEGDGGGPADAGEDLETPDDDAGPRTGTTCEDLDCASTNRECLESRSGDASCGDCLDGFLDEGGACVEDRSCGDDDDCVPDVVLGDWSDCAVAAGADACAGEGSRTRTIFEGRCASGRCEVSRTEQTERCTDSLPGDGDACIVDEVESECDGGVCVVPCVSGTLSNVGCEFWAIDLDQFAVACSSASRCGTGDSCQSDGYCSNSARSTPFAVSVSNSSNRDVSVVAYAHDGTELARATVSALNLATLSLPQAGLDDTTLNTDAVRIEADGPVTMYQFNPATNVGAFSNDASLLLPATAVGREYIVNGYTGIGVADGQVSPGKPYIAVIAVAAGTTAVTITPSTATLASEDGTIAAIIAGETATFTMEQGETLTLSGGSAEGADFTGTVVEATQPVSVFSGTECSGIPAGVAYCDHIEEQLTPVDTWGVEYVAAGFKKRGTEDTVWRIVASVDGTRIRTIPDSLSANEQFLDRGEVYEFRTGEDFFLGSSAPVSLGAFMVGSSYAPPGGTCDRNNPFGGNDCAIEASCASGSGIGDPAFMLAVPNEQFRTDYIVLTPDEYQRDYFTIVAPTGTVVALDGESVDEPEASIGGFSVYRPRVTDGVHRVQGDQPFGLYAYGYDCDVSYAYPGGMNLQSISP